MSKFKIIVIVGFFCLLSCDSINTGNENIQITRDRLASLKHKNIGFHGENSKKKSIN